MTPAAQFGVAAPAEVTILNTTLELKSASWCRHGATHVRGQAFDQDGRLHRANALAALLDACPDAASWQEAVANLNGSFAAVTARASELLAAVDRVRTIPLFYAIAGKEVVVSDDAYVVQASLGTRDFDPLAVREFELTGYVTGGQTLVPGLLQVRAGTIVRVTSGELPVPEVRNYYTFRHGNFDTSSEAQRIDKLVATHQGVFERLATDVGDRPLVIPLSGGFDSRLIGVAIKELGLTNVLCYTYGVGNWETRISQELARYLGLRWTMVTYTAEKWRKWAATPEFQEYFRAAGNLASVPHVQDWPAVYEMKRDGLLAEDAIFVPGHTGDFIEGGHVPKSFANRTTLSHKQLLDAIVNIHYSLWDWPRAGRAELRKAMERRIESIIGSSADMSQETAADAVECWDWQERQAKFICNSVRVYDFFGYEWRLPLWDARLMDFWSHVPVEQRIARSLYGEFVRRHQSLPITPANNDYPAVMNALLHTVDALRLRPLAKHVQRIQRRLTWQQQYEGGSLAWLAVVDRDEFRARYTGREIGHSFFARRYLDVFAR